MTIENKKAAAILRRQLSALNIGTGALALAVASSWAIPAIAQQTTSSMTGQITTAAGAPATGAEVTIVHTPSGTRSVTTVNDQGRFQAGGLRVGGPYTVTITSSGSEPQVLEGIFVSLGEPFALDLALGAKMEEIVVTGERTATTTTVGIGTNFNQQQINNAPSISRDLKDIVRNDPKVFIDVTNSSAIQIAGSSNRFNSLTIDGVKQNDDFGLNAGGYPTQRSPLSIDAIEGLSVLTAPYDVEYSGFQGGTINIVTKSGENTPHGSFFYYYGDDSLSGTRSGNNRNLISPYKEKTWGGSLGGALIEDKLFFYTSYEKFKSQAPVVFGTSDSGLGNPVAGITSAQVAQIRAIAQSVYGYDTLGLADGSLPEEDEKILAKLDWNISDAHRASFAYQRNEGNNIRDASSSTSATPRTLSLQSNMYNYTQIMDSYSFQLFSDWSSDFSTEVKLARKEVDSLRLPLNGMGFGEMRISTLATGLTPNNTNNGQVVIGPDISSHSNVLNTKTDSAKLKGTYLLGDHKITGGYEYENVDYYNLFLQRSLGYWEFASIEAFQNRQAQRFRYANAVSGNPEDAAAKWDYTVHSFYLQDTWDINPDFQLQGGLRYELYKTNDEPLANANFLTRYGFSNNATIDGIDLWLPRLGFSYDATESTVVRGGAGLFSGTGAAVWLSNGYSNDGVTQRSLDITRSGTLTAANALLLNGVTGQVPSAATTRLTTVGEGFVNALDPNYKMPSSWKFSMAVDQKVDIPGLGDDWLFTAEAIYTRVKDANFYRDLRLVKTGTAPDGRPIYTQNIQAGDTRGNGSDLLLTNTDKGKSLILTLYGSKYWETEYGDVDFGAGYAYQDSDDASQGTSSVAGSNYEQFVTTDPNSDLLGTSSYETKHRFTMNTSYSVEYFDGFKSSLSLFGQAYSGKPYTFSFTCSSTANPFGDPACRSNRSREAMYVPTGASDPLVNWTASTVKADVMDAYISRNGLDKYRGGIVPRGAFESSWTYSVDAKLAQEIPAPIEGHKAIITMDIINLTNLLNKDWGRQEAVPFFQSIAGPTATIGTDGKYVFTAAGRDVTEQLSNRASVWKIQLGVKYEF
ncbi:TonB-dependent receptor [Niveispirillum sp. KHB5.9]|uniref:TonB-dependent receptor n=1 Tax=Niveispirillum sp. KHB5.9 TaxID=3400269 RepID=UPI003A887ED2